MGERKVEQYVSQVRGSGEFPPSSLVATKEKERKPGAKNFRETAGEIKTYSYYPEKQEMLVVRSGHEKGKHASSSKKIPVTAEHEKELKEASMNIVDITKSLLERSSIKKTIVQPFPPHESETHSSEYADELKERAKKRKEKGERSPAASFFERKLEAEEKKKSLASIAIDAGEKFSGAAGRSFKRRGETGATAVPEIKPDQSVSQPAPPPATKVVSVDSEDIKTYRYQPNTGEVSSSYLGLKRASMSILDTINEILEKAIPYEENIKTKKKGKGRIEIAQLTGEDLSPMVPRPSTRTVTYGRKGQMVAGSETTRSQAERGKTDYEVYKRSIISDVENLIQKAVYGQYSRGGQLDVGSHKRTKKKGLVTSPSLSDEQKKQIEERARSKAHTQASTTGLFGTASKLKSLDERTCDLIKAYRQTNEGGDDPRKEEDPEKWKRKGEKNKALHEGVKPKASNVPDLPSELIAAGAHKIGRYPVKEKSLDDRTYDLVKSYEEQELEKGGEKAARAVFNSMKKKDQSPKEYEKASRVAGKAAEKYPDYAEHLFDKVSRHNFEIEKRKSIVAKFDKNESGFLVKGVRVLPVGPGGDIQDLSKDDYGFDRPSMERERKASEREASKRTAEDEGAE